MDKQRPTPPAWSTKFLAWFLKEDYYEDVQGDLEEEFQIKASNSGSIRAKRWYSWQIIRLFKPSMMKELETQHSIEKETTMFRNYFKIGLRNLWKYKSSTVINVIGLSTGLAAFVLIALFLRDELSYDKHFENVEEIHRVTVKNFTLEGEMSRQWAFASAGHAKRLKEDYSGITHAVRFYPWAFPDILVEDKTFRGEQVIFAGEDVFDVFSFKFIEGDPETALNDLYSLVLTESTAIKLFGTDWRDQNIIGKQVKLRRGQQEAPFKVTGVMEDMPDQQHFHFDYLAPIRFIEMLFGERASNNVGGNYNWMTYVRIPNTTDVDQLTNEINDEFWDKYIEPSQTGVLASNFYDFEFQPITDIHLTSNLEGEFENNGSIQQVYIFGIVGLLLLLVACVNYMNIATSHYSRRMKEVGVRKVIGAFKTALVKQFLTESILITIVSLPICILLILWTLPHLNLFMEKSMVFNPFAELKLLGGLVVLLLGVGLIAGLYPALFLSKVNLVQALKGEQSINAKKWNFRSWLVAFQYTVTIALIFAIAVIESQMQFIRNSDPGYEREQVLIVRTFGISDYETFKNELLADPHVLSASYSSRIPTGRLADSMGSSYFIGDSAVASGFRLPYISVDKDFLDTYEIDLVAGEYFRDGMEVENLFQRDSSGRFITAPASYVINQTAAKSFGYENPSDIIGNVITYGPSKGRIIGIMQDFHFESMHSEIAPMLMMYRENYNRISLKLRPDNIKSTLEHIENTWGKFQTDIPINYTFLDESFNDQYRQEQRLSSIIKVFAAIAILIGCLGLIGMVGFIIETKLKEIGIRKVLGASTSSIWIMISNRFLILVGIGFTVALPITYYLMDGWLDDFVYRTTIGFFTIFLPIVLAIGLTLLAISYQTMKATKVNPVECLKDE